MQFKRLLNVCFIATSVFLMHACQFSSRNTSKQRYINTNIIIPGLYVQKYCSHESGAGPFDTGTDYQFYLDDSSGHTVFLGTVLDDEFFDLKLMDSLLIVRKICECRDLSDLSVVINTNKLVDSVTYDLGKLGFRIPPIRKLNASEQLNAIKSVSANMVFIKGDTFLMGSNWTLDQQAVHKVLLKNFYVSKYEVTQSVWLAVMNQNPSCYRNCMDCPVENVSWYEVQKFIGKINELTHEKYRLPTEAEWEFVSGGGRNFKNYTNSLIDSPSLKVWYSENSDRTHPVGQKRANALGLFDMSGNVSEWCSDWYGDRYDSVDVSNPQGPLTGMFKVRKGGGWNSGIYDLRPSDRDRASPEFGHTSSLGFRLVKD